MSVNWKNSEALTNESDCKGDCENCTDRDICIDDDSDVDVDCWWRLLRRLQ